MSPPGADERRAARLDAFLAQVPEEVRASFTAAQREALAEALERRARRHAVDIRVSLPLLITRAYVALHAGRERRHRVRRRHERRHYPLRTFGNAVFVGLVSVVAVLLAIAGVLVYSAVLEP